MLLLLTGCTADTFTVEQATERIPIGVSASVSDVTRASSELQVSQFDVNETFYVHFSDGDITEPHACYTTTTVNGTTTLATGSTQPFFVEGATTATLYAYYPQTVTETTTSFSVAADQTLDVNYKQSDLMFATAEATKEGVTVNVPLQFYHKLAKLTIIAQVDADISNITDISIISGGRTINITDPLTCTLGTTISDALSAGSPLAVYQDATGVKRLACAAVLPPQDIAGDFIKVTTATDGSVVYNTTKTLVSGHNYTIVLNISRAALARTYAVINNWGEPSEAFTDPDDTLHF